jgi:hypothetical protein
MLEANKIGVTRGAQEANGDFRLKGNRSRTQMILNVLQQFINKVRDEKLPYFKK